MVIKTSNHTISSHFYNRPILFQ